MKRSRGADLPRLFPSTHSVSGRPTRQSRNKIPRRLWNTVYVCQEYPDGVFIDKYGHPDPSADVELPKEEEVKLVTNLAKLQAMTAEEKREQADLAYDLLLQNDRKRAKVVENKNDDDDDYEFVASDEDDEDDDDELDEDELDEGDEGDDETLLHDIIAEDEEDSTEDEDEDDEFGDDDSQNQILLPNAVEEEGVDTDPSVE